MIFEKWGGLFWHQSAHGECTTHTHAHFLFCDSFPGSDVNIDVCIHLPSLFFIIRNNKDCIVVWERSEAWVQ